MDNLLRLSDSTRKLIQKCDPELHKDIELLMKVESNLNEIIILINQYEKDQNNSQTDSQKLVGILNDIEKLLKSNQVDIKQVGQKLTKVFYRDEDKRHAYVNEVAFAENKTEDAILKEMETEIEQITLCVNKIPNDSLVSIQKVIHNIRKKNSEEVSQILHQLSYIITGYMLIKRNSPHSNTNKIMDEINLTHNKIMQLTNQNSIIEKMFIVAKNKLLSAEDFYANDNIYYHLTPWENLSKILDFGLENQNLLQKAKIIFSQGFGQDFDGLTVNGIYAFSPYGQIKYSIYVLSNMHKIKKDRVVIFTRNRENFFRLMNRFHLEEINMSPHSTFDSAEIYMESLMKLNDDEIKEFIAFEYGQLQEIKQMALSRQRFMGYFSEEDIFTKKEATKTTIIFEEESIPFMRLGPQRAYTEIIFSKRIRPGKIRAVLIHENTSVQVVQYLLNICKQHGVPVYRESFQGGIYGKHVFSLLWPN